MNPRDLIVVGAGGMATNIVDFFNLEEDISHYYDDPKEKGEELFGVPVIPLIQDNMRLVSVVGDTRHKRDLINRAILSGAVGQNWISLVHYDAWLAKSVKYGSGTVIQPMTNIYSRVKIGNHALICGGSRIGHNTEIGDFCTLSPEVAIGGSCKISNGVFLGLNCTVRDGVKIGQGAIIGCGAVVVKDIPENWVVGGNPAKHLKTKERW